MILGERLDLESTKPEKVKLNEHGQRVVRTVKGREVAADLLVCYFILSDAYCQTMNSDHSKHYRLVVVYRTNTEHRFA